MSESTDLHYAVTETTKADEEHEIEIFGRKDEPVEEMLARILGYRLVRHDAD